MTLGLKPLPTVLPVIGSDDYESFRDILGSHIPDTYDQWLKGTSNNDVFVVGSPPASAG